MTTTIKRRAGVIQRKLCGRGRRDGREALIFAEPGVRHQRQVVFVDAILELAALIRREHEAGGDD